jgi:hypothetical protein
MRPIRTSAVLVFAAALTLSACASDATFLRGDGSLPSPNQLEADASDCRSIWPVLAGFFGGALLGAAHGAMIGAASGGADVGAIAGAGAGGLIGLVAGAATSAAGDGYERCMMSKGYRRGDSEPASSDDKRPIPLLEPAR